MADNFFLQIVFSTSNEPKLLKTVIKTLPEHSTMKKSAAGKKEIEPGHRVVVVLESQAE